MSASRISVHILLFLLSASFCHAQKEYNIWYFGRYAGLDFNGGSPAALTNSAMFSSEGTGTLCDTSGKLLMYTNGIRVWDRNHHEMPNGNGLLSGPSMTTTQTGMIIRKPGSSTVFYIFNVYEAAEAPGLSYSTMDLTQNGGMGDVVQKNIRLTGPVSEKLSAVYHANKKDIWIVVHGWNSDEFYSFLVTKDGVAMTPVVSRAGTVHSGTDNFIGQMKVSPNGKKLALTISRKVLFELFDFNTMSGAVSNPVSLPAEGLFGIDAKSNSYGVEFSPDASKLYGTVQSPSRILQFDLKQDNIRASMRSLVDTYCLGLQLAPDGKIYSATPGFQQLGAIINPDDSPGAPSHFIYDAVSLSGRDCDITLPGIIAGSTAVPALDCSLIKFGMASVAAVPGEKNIRIPVLLSIGREFYPRRISRLSFRLRISGDCFIPDAAFLAQYGHTYDAAANEYIIRYSGHNVDIGRQEEQILEITGSAYLGKDDRARMIIDSAVVDECSDIAASEMTLDISACFLAGRRVQKFEAPGITMSPLPANDLLTLELAGVNESGARITVYDSFGAEKIRFDLAPGMARQMQIPLNGLASGSYIVELRTEWNVIHKKLLIVH